MKRIPKYILHGASVKHNLMLCGYTDIPSLNDNWYFDIDKRTIVLEGT